MLIYYYINGSAKPNLYFFVVSTGKKSISWRSRNRNSKSTCSIIGIAKILNHLTFLHKAEWCGRRESSTENLRARCSGKELTVSGSKISQTWGYFLHILAHSKVVSRNQRMAQE